MLPANVKHRTANRPMIANNRLKKNICAQDGCICIKVGKSEAASFMSARMLLGRMIRHLSPSLPSQNDVTAASTFAAS